MYEANVIDDANAAQRLWGMFEDEWWRESASDSRVDRIQLDRLLNHWMMATTRKNVAYNRVASDFRVYLGDDSNHDIYSISDRIRSSGTVYRNALNYMDSDPYVIGALRRMIGDMNIVVVMPLILYLKADQIPDDRYRRCIQIVESYLVRRALYGRITQGLTDFFIRMLDRMHQERPTHCDETLSKFLDSQTNDTLMWPNDNILFASLRNRRMPRMNAQRRKMILVEVERKMRKERMTEELGSTKNLTVEHIMPQRWRENWSLPSSARLEDSERREEAVHFLGNLTLTTSRLNSSLSNAAWPQKRETLQHHSTLLLNTEMLSNTPGDWDEDEIESRGASIALRILDIWKPAKYFLDNPL